MPFAPHRLPSPHRRPLLDTPHQSAGAIDVSPHLVVTVEHVKAHAQRVRIPPLGAMASGSPAAPVAGGGVAGTGEVRSEIPATQAVAKCRAGLGGRRYQAVVLPADLRRPVVGRVRVLGLASVDHRERPRVAEVGAAGGVEVVDVLLAAVVVRGVASPLLRQLLHRAIRDHLRQGGRTLPRCPRALRLRKPRVLSPGQGVQFPLQRQAGILHCRRRVAGWP